MTVFIYCLFQYCTVCSAADLKIYPQHITVKTGHVVRFTAVADEESRKNYTPESCLWTATGGQIDSDGNYSAFNHPGTYQACVFANGKKAQATVTVVTDTAYTPIKVGAIFIRKWHFFQTEDPSKVNLRVSALTKGETVKSAKLFLINDDGSEKLLGTTPTHHNGRAKFQAFYTPARGQWLDFKTYDHLNRLIAHTRRMI